jgi:prevent-host-death family protein
MAHSTPAKRVGVYEVKTHLAALLNQVAKGKEIIITKRERPVARLMPIESTNSNKNVFDRIRAFHGKITLPKGETAKDLIEAGRRL